MNWLKKVALCWIVVAPVLRLILPWFFEDLPVQTWLVCQADALAIGGCVAMFRNKLQDHVNQRAPVDHDGDRHCGWARKLFRWCFRRRVVLADTGLSARR